MNFDVKEFLVFFFMASTWSTVHPKSSLTRYEKKVGSELRLILGNSGMKRKKERDITWNKKD